jgi:hypothetical protein
MAELKTDSLAFQGRLTGTSDNPVPDGPRDLILSLWTDSLGGTMLHSEVITVSVSNGLYSTCIGCASSSFFDIFTDQPLFLQTQLAGQSPMTPRIRMRNSPHALVSARIRGDIATAPGSLVVGDSTTGGYAKVNAGLHAAGSALAQGASLITHDCDDTDASASFGHSQGSNVGIINMRSTADSTDLSISQSDPSGESGMSMKGKGIRKNISVTLFRHESSSARSLSLSADSGSAGVLMDNDDDGDGTPECSAEVSTSDKFAQVRGFKVEISGRSSSFGTVCDSNGVSSSLDIDDDGDSVPESEISQILTPTTSSMAIKTKGTGAAHNRVISTTTPDSVVTEQTFEFTNSLLMPALMKAKEKANRTKCSNNLRYQSPIANNEAEFAVDSAGSGSTMSADSDGDGNPEAKLVGKIVAGTFSGGPGTVSIQLADIDDDGDPEGEISETVLPTTSSMAIKTKGTGAAHGRAAITQTTDSSGAVSVHTADSDDDGDPEGQIDAFAGPLTCSMAIKTKGTGAAHNRVVSQSDTSGAATVVSAGAKNIGLYVQNVGGVSLLMTDASLGTTDTTIIIDGALKRFGIGISQPEYPMHHSSGAHLTAGGVWTNASDANLKENFQTVDGADLLEKIEQLPISEWNYKNESDESRHIGPTAQDFQKVFGVGENDKTISTIDPSGIALAAIKELNKQNQELKVQSEYLKEQNMRLQKQLDELKAMVEDLAAAK